VTERPDLPVLPDGTYPAFVVDAEEDIEATEPVVVHLSVTILTGEHKGEVVDLSATHLDRSSIDLIGMPATLTVSDGVPSLEIDDA
jgi:hypothetical protein